MVGDGVGIGIEVCIYLVGVGGINCDSCLIVGTHEMVKDKSTISVNKRCFILVKRF